MRRLAQCALVLLFAGSFSCASSYPAGSPAASGPTAVTVNPDGTITIPCPRESADPVVIHVDSEARVDKPCVMVAPGEVDVDWEAGAGVRRLIVAFKGGPLPDPGCTGRNCRLRREDHEEGQFAYSVVVVRIDGSATHLDPMLVIHP